MWKVFKSGMLREHLLCGLGAVAASLALGSVIAASLIGSQCAGLGIAVTLLALAAAVFGWPLFFYLLSRELWTPSWRPDALQSIGLLLLCWFLTAFMLLMAPSAIDAPPLRRFIIGTIGLHIMVGLPYAFIFARLIARLLGRSIPKPQNGTPELEAGYQLRSAAAHHAPLDGEPNQPLCNSAWMNILGLRSPFWH